MNTAIRRMIGIGIPISQSKAPLPKPMTLSSSCVQLSVKFTSDTMVPSTRPGERATNELCLVALGRGGTNEATFELHLRQSLSPRRRPGKEIVVKHRSTSPNRVLRNALMASALAAGLTAVSTIRPASAHVDHGQRNDAQYSARFGGAVAWRQNHRQRRGVRDRLLASSSGSGHQSRQLTNNRRSLGGRASPQYTATGTPQAGSA
jgi:hypothetical protein